MRDPARMVGIGRWVRLAWLEETASLVLAGNGKDAVHDALDRMLRDQISAGGNAPRSGREKAITVLLKTWLVVPKGLEPLRDDGLNLLRATRTPDRLAIHWGMLLAAYPFWARSAPTPAANSASRAHRRRPPYSSASGRTTATGPASRAPRAT